MILHIEADHAANDFSFSVLDDLRLLSESWKNVTSMTIQNCFQNARWMPSEITPLGEIKNVEMEHGIIWDIIRQLFGRDQLNIPFD